MAAISQSDTSRSLFASYYQRITRGITQINAILEKVYPARLGVELNATERASLTDRCVELKLSGKIDFYEKVSQYWGYVRSKYLRTIEVDSIGQIVIHFNRHRESVLSEGSFCKLQLSYNLTRNEVEGRITARKDVSYDAVKEIKNVWDLYREHDLHRIPYVMAIYGGREFRSKSLRSRLSLRVFLGINGNLRVWMELQDPYLPCPFHRKLSICKKICQGLEGLHAKGILHRDLKLENVVLDEEGDPRIIDFGMAHYVYARKITHPESGTLNYIPPEQLNEKKVSLNGKGDVYATGVLFARFLFLSRSYLKRHQYVKALERVKQKKLSLLEERMLAIVFTMLEHDPNKRPSAQQVVLWIDSILRSQI